MSSDQYRKSPRASFLDYNGGQYFVTICTQNRECSFGKIVNGEMHFSRLGQFVEKQLGTANKYNSRIHIPLYTVMPNHIHAIIEIEGEKASSEEINKEIALRDPWYVRIRDCEQTNVRHVPILSRYINSFKGSVTKFAKVIGVKFEWQARYHDHYIRGTRDGNQISEYIKNNVANWDKDCFYE